MHCLERWRPIGIASSFRQGRSCWGVRSGHHFSERTGMSSRRKVHSKWAMAAGSSAVALSRGDHAVCRHFQAHRVGLRPGLRTTKGRDEVFFKIVPRSYPWNTHVAARAKHAEVQLRLGVASNRPLKGGRGTRNAKKMGETGGWRCGWIGRAFGVEITGPPRVTRGLHPELYDVAPRGAGEDGRRTIGKMVRDRALVCIFADFGGIATSCKKHNLMSS